MQVSEATPEAQKQKQKTYSLLSEDRLTFSTCGDETGATTGVTESVRVVYQSEATGVRATEAT